MSIVTTSTEYRSLKATLDSIITDPAESGKSSLIYPKYMKVKTMGDNWEEDAEVADELLLQEKAEGATASVGSIQEGFSKRYISRTMARHLHVAEEAIEDSKYDKYINGSKRLLRNAYKTQDLDATNLLILSTSSTQLGGDGVALGSASHTLPYGGTWSNIADVYQTPSRAALIAAITKAGKYPGINGQTEGNEIETIVHPLAQWATWEGILKSGMVPESNANEINVVGPKGSKGGIKHVAIKYLDASTTTLWGAVTDADDGIQWRNRKPVSSRTWVDNDADVMKYGVRYRATKGWSNARGWYQGNT
jgi:hypothetical protein